MKSLIPHAPPLAVRHPLVARLPRGLRRAVVALALLATGLTVTGPAWAVPLRIGYSDWPGWVAWQVGIEKGWFKEAGVDVDFEWFDYSASMDAFSAHKLDADCMTNGDTLVTGAAGGPSVMILLTDYSDGNDIILGKPGVRSLKDLKGRKVAVEVGLVEHLLLEDGLKRAGMKDSDVTLVNAKTNEMPQVLASGDVAAVGAWQPIAGQALRSAPGARPLFTSADEPGLIYDVLAVSPASLSARRADWLKVMKVWYRIVDYIRAPATQADAVKIMAQRVGSTPAEFLPLLKGTHLIDLPEARRTLTPGAGYQSLYGSSQSADAFNTGHGVYKDPQDVMRYIDPSLTASLK